MNDVHPAILAAADQRTADREDGLLALVSGMRLLLGMHDRTSAIAMLGYEVRHEFGHDDTSLLLGIAVARLAELGPAVPDLFAEDVVPAGPHAVACVTRSQDGTPVAVCVCTAVFTGDDEDDAVAALDAHIANPEAEPFRIGDLARADIVAWLNAEPRDLTHIHGMAWCSRVTETGGRPSEVELIDGSCLVVDRVYGVWVPKAVTP